MEARGFTRLERFELKYHVPLARVGEIAEILAPWCSLDPASERSPDGFYWITSLYLETPHRTFLRWTQDKREGRFNMRIRAYGEHPDPCGDFHFEVKQKFRDIVTKTRGIVRGGYPQRLWDETNTVLTAAPPKERHNLDLFLRRSLSYDARPALLTQYRRMAWFGVMEDYARVTLDTGMRWRQEEGFDFSVDPATMRPSDPCEFFDPGANAVLELKCPRAEVPLWMIELIRRLQLVRSGYSKFGNASRESLRLPSTRRTAWGR